MQITMVDAATLIVGQGPVSVNLGGGFQPAVSGVEVPPGSRVMVGSNGSAQLVYNPTCTATVAANTVVIVPPSPPCTPSTPVSPNSALIVGGVVVAGGVGAAVALSNSRDSNRPASP